MSMPTMHVSEIIGRLIHTEIRVGFTDCDPYGHVASGRYLEMAVNHRMSAVTEQLGFDTLKTARDTGIAFVNKEMNLQFKSPAQFDEWLTIESWLDEVLDYRGTVQVRIRNRDSGKVVCKVTIVTVTIDLKDGAPVPIPKEFEPVRTVDVTRLAWAPGHPRQEKEPPH